MPCKPRVFGNATSKEVINKFKSTDVIFGKSKGIIWGSAGLIVAFAKMQKMDAVCLMGETSFLDVDASAAKVVTIQLAKMLGLNVNTANLDKIIEKTANAVRELRETGGHEHRSAARAVCAANRQRAQALIHTLNKIAGIV